MIFALNFKVIEPFTGIFTMLFEVKTPDKFVKSVLETNVKPTGKTSCTCTLLAASVPALFTNKVNSTSSPTLALALLTNFCKLKSATRTLTLVESVSSSPFKIPLLGDESGSGTLLKVISALFVIFPVPVTFAINLKVWL